MRDALRSFKDAHEHLAVGGVPAKRRIHQTTGVVKCPERSCRKPFDAHRFLVEQEGLQNSLGVALVDIVIHHVEHARFVYEKFVQRQGRMCRGFLKQPLLHIQMHDLVQLRDRFGCPVIVLHQSLTGATCVALLTLRRRQTKVLRHRGLQIEHQTVLAPLRNVVQPPAHQRQQIVVALQLAQLQGRDHLVISQVLPRSP